MISKSNTHLVGPVALIAIGLSGLLACSSDSSPYAPAAAGQAGAGAAGQAGSTGEGGATAQGGSAGADAAAGQGGAAASSGAAGAGGNAGAGGTAGASSGPGIDQFTQRASASACDALFRCCNAKDLEDYFYFYTQDAILKDKGYEAKLPPKAQLDLAGCKSLLKEMMDVVPFGDWVAQVKSGAVGYDAAVAEQCAATLDTAACGADVATALFDSTCFYIAAPIGPAQRKMFSRTRASSSDACDPIKDGTGARFFGSCDPTQAFCCYENAQTPGKCAYPFEADGTPRKGHCKAASPDGEACSMVGGSVQLCVTGVDCDSSTGKCVAPVQKPLAVGDPCIDKSFNELGQCANSWCDALGSSKCEALKADGATCLASYECVSKGCNGGKCGAPTTCTSK